MKILLTLSFLAIAAIILFLGNKQIKIALFQIQNRKTSFLKSSFYSSLILSLFFIQYCLLTQTSFPYLILILLIAATILGFLINEIIGSIAGVSVKETRHKVNVMYTAMAFEQSISQPSRIWITIFSSLFLFGSWIAALWSFWANPLGDPGVYVWVAIFIFITPQITGIITNLNTLTPIVASEFIDDDLRNLSLSSNFSTIISSTIYFIFPLFILKNASSETFSWLPPYWVIVLIPLASFVFFGIIPFFIGIYKFKNQKKYFLEWQQNWIQEFKNPVLISAEEKRTSLIHELYKEINTRISENKMYNFLKDLKNDSSEVNSGLTQSEQVIRIFNDNKDAITKWDLQLNFIQKLKEIEQNISNAKDNEELKSYFEDRLDEIKTDLENLEKNKNKMAGILTALITGLLGILLKTYQADLLALLEKFRPQ